MVLALLCLFWDEAGVQPLVPKVSESSVKPETKRQTGAGAVRRQCLGCRNGAALPFSPALRRMCPSALFTAHLAGLNVVGLGCFSP